MDLLLKVRFSKKKKKEGGGWRNLVFFNYFTNKYLTERICETARNKLLT